MPRLVAVERDLTLLFDRLDQPPDVGGVFPRTTVSASERLS